MTGLERYQDPLTIQRVLHGARTVAVVGLSGNELRASNFVGYYLKRHGYAVFPVNPRESEVLGEVIPLLGRRRRLDGVIVVDQIRVPLVGLAAQEPVEALETAS